jgi:AcrR family transcriptional regulator
MPKVSEAYLKARRDQVLDAAWACFGRKGYHETTMQDICREAGVSYGVLYRYFESKEDILRATSERAQAETVGRVAGAREQAASPMETLSDLGAAVFQSFYDPNFETAAKVHLETLPEVLRRPDVLASLRGEIAAWRTAMTHLLSDGRDSGHLSPELNPEGVALLLMCVYEGLRVHRLIDPEAFDPQKVLDALGGLFAAQDIHKD